MNLNHAHKILFLFIVLPILAMGQSATLRGIVLNELNEPIEGVNVISDNNGTTTNINGFYILKIPANTKIKIQFSHINYKYLEAPFNLKNGEELEFNPVLKNSYEQIETVVITGSKRKELEGITTISPQIIRTIKGAQPGVENLLKTLPGVNISNELSTQYSVRGGNFDENLVYVNGIEVYRPFLIRAGQQEGLSFVNTDMVSSILFSAGGFEAKYGDKMSSVLDITYKRPRENAASLQLSMLGGSAHFEGASKNGRFSYLVGARHKTNEYVLNAMDTKADYIPKFSDLQTFINYELNTNWQISFLGNISKNEYTMIPENRDTEFGTLNEALKLTIFFEGKEVDKYETYFGALSTTYQPSTHLNLQITTSAFQTFEQENFDILGEYWLYQLENNLGSDDFGNIAFSPNGDYRELNSEISNKLGQATELRIGGEYRIKAVSLRAGYRTEKSPYVNQTTIGNLTGYSSGFGYNFGGTKLDVTYSHSQRNYQKQFFNVGLTDYSNINSVMNNIIISMTFEL